MQSKNTTVLLALFVILVTTIGLIIVIWTKKDPQPVTQKPPPIPDNAPTTSIKPFTTGAVQVNLHPRTTSTQVGQEILFDVSIDPGKFGVTGVEAHLTYSPIILRIKKIEPSSYFANPDVLINNIDSKTGVIDYAIASRKYSMNPGIAFTIVAEALSTTQETDPILTLSQNTKVGLRDITNNATLGEEQTQISLTQSSVTITN